MVLPRRPPFPPSLESAPVPVALQGTALPLVARVPHEAPPLPRWWTATPPVRGQLRPPKESFGRLHEQRHRVEWRAEPVAKRVEVTVPPPL